MSTFAARWPVLALTGLAISLSCVDSTPGEPPRGEGATEAVPEFSTGQAGMTPELRAAYIAAVQTGAGETYRAEGEASGSARFVHLAQGFEATIDGAEVRLASEQAGNWELSLSTTGLGCEGEPERGLPEGAVEMSGNRVEITRQDVREWYVNGPLGLEQGFTMERAPPCAGTKVVTIEVGGSVVPEVVDEDGDGRGEAIAFADAGGVPVARYTDLYVKDATGNRLSAWMSVTAGRIALHVDDAGAAYPVQIDPLVWVEQAKLTASDGAAGDRFGFSVALSGDTALVGAFQDDNLQGSAYVFTRSGLVWTQQQKLTASDGAANDWFGFSVALSGDTALVGAYADTIGGNLGQGSAYVFTRAGAVWTQQQKLTASDGALDDYFGYSVALEGNTALVGAKYDTLGANTYQGSAYVFIRTGAVWTQQQKLTASDGAANDYFGYSVALSGNTALVGAFGDDAQQGSAYVFTLAGVVWTQQQKLLASDGAAQDSFGFSVALSGDTALVAAQGDDVGATNDAGSAYVFTRTGTVWTQQQQLTPNGSSKLFGLAVALSGDTALVRQLGAVHAFARAGVVWTQQQMIPSSAGDGVGPSVALTGDTALVGAQLDGQEQGSAYIFVLRKANGDTCAQSAECGSGFCVDGICCNGACGGGIPGDCQACSVAAGATVNGTCAPLSMGTVCRASAGACDVAESCDGASIACPADAKVAPGTQCRASGGACDLVESCDGAADACPADAKVAAGTECRASAGECDVVETCDGALGECPADVHAPDGIMCADGMCADGVCMGIGGSGGAGGRDGVGGSGGSVDDPSSCDCQAAGAPSGKTSYAALSLLGVALLVTRRRQRAVRPAPFLTALLLLLVASSSGCLGGASEVEVAEGAPERALRASFPAQADAVLGQEAAFVAREQGFALGAARSNEGERNLDVELPREGSGVIRLRGASGVDVRVREIGVEGEGRLAERAVAYRRAGGTSYWTAVPAGVEEWLLLDEGVARKGETAAAWEVEGATVKQAGDAVEIVDEGGWVRLRVTAPVAYAAGGREVPARLEGRGTRIELSVDAEGEAALVDPLWVTVGSMNTGRDQFDAVLLQTGAVLVVGGNNGATILSSVEVYNASTWAPAAPLTTGRYRHTATMLQNGMALVAGGYLAPAFGLVTSAELYNPATNTWAPAGSLTTGRTDHTATLLQNGKVLVAGGDNNGSGPYRATAELYDPATNTWSPAGPLSTGRSNHTATLLSNGMVLVAGGYNGISYLTSAELYDPATNTWSPAGSLSSGRHEHAATVLQNGMALVAGGYDGVNALSSAELYNPATNTWGPAGSMSTARVWQSATLLQNGAVLVAGGWSQNVAVASAELYNPATNTWGPAGSMSAAGYRHTATLFPNGTVLVAGGWNGGMNLARAELYSPGPVGSACTGIADCTSGFCVDGFCCNAACGGGTPGDCQACSVAAGAAVNGTCAPFSMGTACRPSAGACDVAESCDGMNGACPADAKVLTGTICRASVGACDATESCDGAADVCPADAKVAAGTECRASAGDCDVVETCDGSITECPADVFAPDGTVCGGLFYTCAGGVCQDGGGGSGGAGGSGGSGGAGGAGGSGGSGGAGGAGGRDGVGGSGGSANDPSSCDCQAAGSASGGTSYAALSLLGVAFFVTRRRNRANRAA